MPDSGMETVQKEWLPTAEEISGRPLYGEALGQRISIIAFWYTE